MSAAPDRAALTRQVLSHPVHWLAFGFGSGLAPFAPGTFGSAVGVLAWLALPPLGPLAWAGLLAVLFAAGVYICGDSARRLGVHDHGGIVWDEIVGMLMTLSVAPQGWAWAVAAFVLFRVMDIVKPWPIRDLDHRLGGGFGIMLDDAVAAVYAGAVLYLAVAGKAIVFS